MADSDGSATARLRALPVNSGFRLRGSEMTRLETFADAAFAFAVTMLVVGGGDAIPSSFEEMLYALKQVPAFAASFANIMLFWYAHHRWSRRFGLEDAGSAMLTMALIFVVLVYVYPLKAIYSGAFDFFSGGRLESYFSMQSTDDLRSLFVIFGSGYASLSGVIVMLNRHALSKADEMILNDLERFDTVTEMQNWVINMCVPLLSILLAVVVPERLLMWAGLCYGILGLLMPWYFSTRRRARAKLVG